MGDKDEKIVIVSLTEINTLNATLFQLDMEIFKEIASIAYGFEESSGRETQKDIVEGLYESASSDVDDPDNSNDRIDKEEINLNGLRRAP